MMVQMIMEPPTLAAMTMKTMMVVCVILVEDDDKEDGVALALAPAEEVSVMYTTGAEVGETTCVAIAVVEGIAAGVWATGDDDDDD
jgi:hypothetical protein